jgi:hypothetical protein
MYLAAMTQDAALQTFLDTACPIIQRQGSSFYFTPATLAKGEAVGLDRGQLYFLGRGGVLGDAEPAVVTAAFGYFNPSIVAAVWSAARAKLAPRAAGALFMECCADHGRARLADVAGLARFAASAEKVIAAAEVDGLSLFAGIAAEPLAEDLPGRAMQLVAVLREFRGSAHLIAVRAVGVSAKVAHFVSRPNDGRMFGHPDAVEPTDAQRAAMAQAEAITDVIVAPAYAVLDDAERAEFVATLQEIDAALTA